MKKNLIWNTFGSIFYSVCQWVITVIVVHIADFEAAGYLALAMSTSSSFSAISLFSMRNYQVSDVRGEYTSHEYVGSRVISCGIALVSCVIYAGVATSTYQMLCTAAFMLVRVSEAAVDVLHGINQKYDRYDMIGKSYILRGIATVVIFVGGLICLDNMAITLGCVAVINLLIALLCDWKWTTSLEQIKPVLLSEPVISLLIKCVPLVIFSFLLSLENLIPKSVLQGIQGTEALGIYSSIATPTLIVQMFASVVFIPFLPRISSLYNEKEYVKFSKMLHKVYLALVGLSIVVTVGAMIFGRLGLQILYTKEILKYYELFLPIVWCTILLAFIWVLSSVIIAIRRIKWLLIGMVMDFGICLLLVQPCIEKFGKNGVSMIQILVYSLYVLFMIGVCEVTLKKDIKRESKSV